LGSSPSPARRNHASPTRGRSPNRNDEEARGHRSPSPGGCKGKGKGKGKGKPAAKCKFCWKRTGDYESAVKQHTYWSQNCIAWQFHLQGYPWNQAEELAAQTKARRVARFEAEVPWHTGSSSWRTAPAEPTWRDRPAEPENREPVLRPRREKKQKEREEPKGRKHRKDKEPKDKKKKDKKKARSPTPEVKRRRDRDRRRRGSDSDSEEKDITRAKRQAPRTLVIRLPKGYA